MPKYYTTRIQCINSYLHEDLQDLAQNQEAAVQPQLLNQELLESLPVERNQPEMGKSYIALQTIQQLQTAVDKIPHLEDSLNRVRVEAEQVPVLREQPAQSASESISLDQRCTTLTIKRDEAKNQKMLLLVEPLPWKYKLTL